MSVGGLSVGGWGYVERVFVSTSSMTKSAATMETGDGLYCESAGSRCYKRQNKWHSGRILVRIHSHWESRRYVPVGWSRLGGLDVQYG